MKPPDSDDGIRSLVFDYLALACVVSGAEAGYGVLGDVRSGGRTPGFICCNGEGRAVPDHAPSWVGAFERWVPDPAQVLLLPAGAAAPAVPAEFKALAADGLLRVPLLVGSEVTGALILCSRRGALFSGREVALVESVARVAAGACLRAQLYADERANRRVAQTLAAFSMAVTESFDVDVVMGVLLDYLLQLVPYDRATAMLLEGDLRFSVRAVRSAQSSAAQGPPIPATIDAGAVPLLRDLVDHQRGVKVVDLKEQPDWPEGLGAPGSRSWMGVPLITKDRVIGLYCTEMDAPAQYEESHLALAETLAAQAAAAIQSAWLFEKVAEGRSRLRSLSRLLVRIQEDERRAVSRELHDESGQSLAALKLGLHLLEGKVGDPKALQAGIADLRGQVDGVLVSLHRMATNLRPASLDHVGVAAALRQMVESYNLQEGPRVDFESTGLEDVRLSEFAETALYRIGQEAVSNAVQHAGAAHVSVLLKRRRSKVVLVVEDNGRGFDPVLALHTGRLGLMGMRERAEMVGGTVLVESAEGKGTVVVAEVPDAGPDHSG